jgi:hypothetical protein
VSNANYLDRDGTFKGRPVSWRVKTFESSRSVAIAIEFGVVAQLIEQLDENGDKVFEWQDWSEYAEVRVRGDYFVVKKDGQPNVGTCEQLAGSLGWNGSLKAVSAGKPPDCVVQVAVKADTYNGETRYKAGWMNPEDYVPTGGGADAETVEQLESQFGSLLRAATSGKAKPKQTPKQAPPKPASPPSETSEQPVDYGDIPF